MLDKPAPQPVLECWAQGSEPALSELTGQAILIEVIQVNCPGCFVHALPEAIRLHENYAAHGLKVFAIATAFEHFEHNTTDNLQRLLLRGELQGEPLSQLGKAGFLDDGKLPYSIPFSVAMDKLVPVEAEASEKDITQFILNQIPDFFHGNLSDDTKQSIYRQAENYLNGRTHKAITFEMYNLQGTPSSILIDKKGILRRVSFGVMDTLEQDIRELLNE